ncbi:MAG: hypothetical protein JWM81_1134 [Candidatus Saccharibacteria bacterium]|nr:hypothetical protein [Candidatus Saccharibacteria bacterium]
MNFSRVQFPRLEGEDSKSVYWRVQEHPWISPLMVQNLLDAATNKEKGRLNLKEQNNWWGVYHFASKSTTDHLTFPIGPGLNVDKFSHQDDSRSLPASREFWIDLFQHDYMWDEQAVPGHSWEAVLRSADEESEQELMVLHGRMDPRKRGKQRLAVNRAGIWLEPHQDKRQGIKPTMDYEQYLAIFGELVLQHATPDQIFPAVG